RAHHDYCRLCCCHVRPCQRPDPDRPADPDTLFGREHGRNKGEFKSLARWGARLDVKFLCHYAARTDSLPLKGGGWGRGSKSVNAIAVRPPPGSLRLPTSPFQGEVKRDRVRRI